MNSDDPAEYVTLRKGSHENYALFYSKRSKDMSKCENGMGTLDESIHYGTTRFNKVRININTLQIVDDDYQFSHTVGEQQKFATGGDCYSNTGSCPQGDFYVNLEGTGFRIRPSMSWEANGTNATIDYQIRVSRASLIDFSNFIISVFTAREALSKSEGAVWRLLWNLSTQSRHLSRRSMKLKSQYLKSKN
jgi:GON domain